MTCNEGPSDRELKALSKMDALKPEACVREIMRLWNHYYGRAVWRGGYLRLVTGGWSDNEAIIGHLPRLFDLFYKDHWRRGGLHVYKVPRRLK